MGFKEKVLEQIEAAGLKDFTTKGLCKRLGIYASFERKILSAALKELCDDGKLVEASADHFLLQASDSLVKGVLKGNRCGFAFLIREDGGADLFVPNRLLNGALHKDTVIASLTGNLGESDEAEVVKVVERGVTEVVGTLEKQKAGYGFVKSDDDAYFSDVFVPAADLRNVRNGAKVVVKLTEFGGKNPVGQIKEVLGKSGSVDADVLAIVRSHGFKESFSDAATDEADRLSKENIEKEIRKRSDFRSLPTITIDGDDAKDFDDAVSLETLADGYVLYVHIADVSHFVRPGSAVDREALERTTSVYLPNVVLPMLPESISNGCCSLVEGEDRLTLTAVIKLDKTGKVAETDVKKSVIRSNHRLTYKKVAAMLDGDEKLIEKYADVFGMISEMKKLSDLLAVARHNRGSIDFVTHESLITLNDTKTKVEKVERYPILASNDIIEEFMLLANEQVAEFMCRAEYPFVFRVHGEPQKEKLDVLQKFVEGCGFQFKVRNKLYSKQLQMLLEQVKGSETENIINKVMLRSMQKAKYSTENEGHFGLALEYYCHFTSPIRRYPDLMIHRVIKMMLDGKLEGAALKRAEEDCETVAKLSSEMEREADLTERDADDYFKAMYMEDKVGDVTEGIVSGVTGSGVFVELENTVEGFAPLSQLPRDRYAFDEKRYVLKGTKHSFGLGDKVTVLVTGASTDARRVDFELF